MSPEQLDNFEQAFSSGTGGCSSTCPCGKKYFDDFNDYDSEWEVEKKKLRLAKAVPLEHSVGGVIIDGVQYVDACECWHARAERIVMFLGKNGRAVAKFLTLEKERKRREAENSPVVVGDVAGL